MDYKSLCKLEKKYKNLQIANIISIVFFCLWFLIGAFIIASKLDYPDFDFFLILVFFVSLCLAVVLSIIFGFYWHAKRTLHEQLELSILSNLGLKKWQFTNKYDYRIDLKSRQSVENYDDIKFFKSDRRMFDDVKYSLEQKREYANKLRKFIKHNEFESFSMYQEFLDKMKNNIQYASVYRVFVNYSSPAGRSTCNKTIVINPSRIQYIDSNKELIMAKSEYSKYVKDIEAQRLQSKRQQYYDRINKMIDMVVSERDKIKNKDDLFVLENNMSLINANTFAIISRIKDVNNEHWALLDKEITIRENAINDVITINKKRLDYYTSPSFIRIKKLCDSLLASQRSFNEYLDEKINNLSLLFGGKNISREETIYDDIYKYIHPYKKTIDPFVAEVSAAIFSSAENKPLNYIIKYFYPNKEQYPEQIEKLQSFITELQTLKDAKEIIDNYKKDIKEYIKTVPKFILEDDEDEFYSRLGFATINENTFTFSYKFSYTSNAGLSQRSFSINMTEKNVIELIRALESKLTISAFSREQRSLMTSKLRRKIIERDNHTCQICGNSTYEEPNLLLEIDHIIPVSKGGHTEETNLQTLCWRCNRHKGSSLS